jgi:hypothetical protein
LRTDLHIFQGYLDHREEGGIIGHETLAEVVEPEPGSAFRAGDRVVINPVLSCGTCRACRMGASYVCYGLRILGVDVDGGLREFYPAPTDRLLKVPDALGDDQAALIEPLSVATHDVTRAAVKAGDSVMARRPHRHPHRPPLSSPWRPRAGERVNPFRVELPRVRPRQWVPASIPCASRRTGRRVGGRRLRGDRSSRRRAPSPMWCGCGAR